MIPSSPMWQGKFHQKVFLQKKMKKLKDSVGTEKQKTTNQLTVQHSNEIEFPIGEPNLLPSSSVAAGYTARRHKFENTIGQTLYNATLYEK